MFRKLFFPALIGSIAALGVWQTANAETVEYTDTVPLMTTNWIESLEVPLFDPALGELVSVSCEVNGHAEGSAQFESLDSDPATVLMELAAEIELQRPNGSPLVTALPLVNTSDDVTAFDGVIDFAGTSGRTYDDLNADDTESAFTTDAGDLAMFTGVGTVSLPVEARGASTGSGAGNLLLQFMTMGSADIKIIYEYEGPVPTLEYSWGRAKSIYR